MTSYAIIQTGGKQYQVKSGDVLDVEKLEAEVGTRVELADVRLVSEDSGLSVGTPTVDGALVTAEVEDQFRGPKIIVFKYKNKTHYRKKNGHRQSYTRIRIQDILTGGATPPPFVPKAPVAQEPEAIAEAPVAEEPVAEAPAVEAPAKPARRTRTRAAAATTTTEATTEAATEEKAKPARRTRTRATAATTEAATDEKPAPPKRRTRAAAKKDTPTEDTSEENKK